MMVIRSYANSMVAGLDYSNGVHVTVYPSTLPQAYPNGQQPFYPNVNVQQTVFPNGQPPNPNGQPPIYPNSQVPGSSDLPPPYPSGQPQMPLPPVSEMKRDL